jgi:predicted NBD/HSP70 family sugar kinase
MWSRSYVQPLTDGFPVGTISAVPGLDVRRGGLESAAPLIALLRARGPLTRAALGEATGLSRTTVSNALMELRRRELLVDADAETVPTGGRPAGMVSLTARAGVAVGVDLGRTHVRVALADGGHRVLAEEAVRFDVYGDADGAVATAARLVTAVLRTAKAPPARVLGIGLGVPAPLDADGRIGSSNILPGWMGRAPAEELAALTGIPVRAENDANLGGLAESIWGAGRDRHLMVYIKAASGIGAGLLVDGLVYRGASGTAGEIGHTVVSESGPVCRCGNRGCLEMLAGGPALLALLSPSGTPVRTVAELVARARDGDPGCRRVLADAGEYIGVAVANLVNLLNPGLIVFGGELGLADELILTTLRARVQRASLPPAAQAVVVVPAVLGDRAESLGGALLPLRETFRFGLDRAAAMLAG